MLSLQLPPGALRIVCLGAHPDDIEIGCGGTLLTLAGRRQITASHVVLTGAGARERETIDAARRFLPAAEVTVEVVGLPDARLPAHWAEVKDSLEALGHQVNPDLIFAPRRDDAHQDHRLIAELVTTVWRDTLVLHYEVPKWDGDLGRVNHYVPITADTARLKVELLFKSFPSQANRDWWNEETFLSLMRIRGMECRNRYAEGFTVSKAMIEVR